MKNQLLIVFFVIIISCKFCCGLESNSNNDLEEAIGNLTKSVTEVWKDIKKMSINQPDKENLYETGRGKKIQKMAIPLMFGFKMAGVVIAALTALKFLLLQSLVLSKFALAGALVLALKVVFDHMHGHLYKVTDVSHISSGPYSYPSHLGLESAQYESFADPANVGYAYYTPTAAEPNAEELQGHYFSGVFQTAQSKNSTGAATDRLYHTVSKRPNSKIVRLKTIIRKTTNSK